MICFDLIKANSYNLFSYCSVHFQGKVNIRNLGNWNEWLLTSLAESFVWSPRKSTCANKCDNPVPETLCTLSGRWSSPGTVPLKTISVLLLYVNNAGNYESQIPSLCTDFKFVEYLSHCLKSKAFYDVDLRMDHFYFSVVLSIFILFPLP